MVAHPGLVALCFGVGLLLAVVIAHLLATRDARPQPGGVWTAGERPFFLVTPVAGAEFDFLDVQVFTDAAMSERADLRDFASRPLADVLSVAGRFDLPPEVAKPAQAVGENWLPESSTPVRTVTISCVGWPWRCLHATWIDDPQLTISTPARWPVPAYRPLWKGLAADAAVFATLPLTGVLAWRQGRGFARRRRGGCPRCGYDLSGQASAGCPECGWNRT